MATPTASWTLNDLAERVGGVVHGDANKTISRPVPAGTDAPDGITFAKDASYLEAAVSSRIGAVVVPLETDLGDQDGILVANPRAAFGQIMSLFEVAIPIDIGIHPSAVVSPDAQIAANASIGAFVTISQGCSIGEGVKIHSSGFIGPNCHVGSDTILMPNVSLVCNVTVGNDCIIHAGCVLGADGFGFEVHDGKIIKIPQIGGVRIGNNVEIGANSCVDRGAIEDTQIGNHTKIDNLCQIGHNVVIGDNCLVAGMTGIGGSARIGSNVVIGAQAGIRDHSKLAPGTVLGARTAIMADVESPEVLLGTPAMPIRSALKVIGLTQRLPEIYDRLKKLEAKVEAQSDN